MSDEPNFGPSPETIRRLHESLPGFVQQQEEKRIFRGGKPISKSRAHKCCKVCGKLFDFRMIEPTLPELAVCEKCQKELDKGYIAFTSTNNYCFAKSKSLDDLKGTVQEISQDVMAKLQDCFELEWNVKEDNNDEDGTTS
jgi:hypothetical protein